MASTKEIPKLESQDKIGQILSILQARIIEGEWPTGTELPAEKDLAKDFGVSRFSLREALRVAESQGLIKIQQGKRPVVAHPSASPITEIMSLVLKRTSEDLFDLVKARSGLECVIVRAAAEKITEAELHALEENIKLMEITGRNLSYYIEKDTEFHSIILKSTRSMVFEIMLASVNALITESRKETLAAGGSERANELHKEIFAALSRHDPDEAERKMARHMKNAEEDLRRASAR